MTNNSRDQANRELSYPSVEQTADGAINMAFTFHRRAIKYVRVTVQRDQRAVVEPRDAHIRAAAAAGNVVVVPASDEISAARVSSSPFHFLPGMLWQ